MRDEYWLATSRRSEHKGVYEQTATTSQPSRGRTSATATTQGRDSQKTPRRVAEEAQGSEGKGTPHCTSVNNNERRANSMGNSPGEAALTHGERNGEDRTDTIHTISGTGNETRQSGRIHNHRSCGYRGCRHRLFLLDGRPLIHRRALQVFLSVSSGTSSIKSAGGEHHVRQSDRIPSRGPWGYPCRVAPLG